MHIYRKSVWICLVSELVFEYGGALIQDDAHACHDHDIHGSVRTSHGRRGMSLSQMKLSHFMSTTIETASTATAIDEECKGEAQKHTQEPAVHDGDGCIEC